ncbi:YdcF family protein [Haliea sp. E17]|uniref:YdcF family protein n=1 Tax=Haliea sp. E17 TaxID=3401576 RepID=UPI003AB064EF
MLLWRWRRFALACCILATSWLYLCSTAWFADWVMGTLEMQFPPQALSVIPPADAIVVLGGATRGYTHMASHADLNAQADRLVQAALLYRAGKAPLVLFSGGSGTGGPPEAEQMVGYLELMGIPRKAILLERGSTDTRENALNSARLLRLKGLQSILLVTSGFHMPRAQALFARQGLLVIPAPTDFQRPVGPPAVPRWLPMVDDLQRTTWALREYVGLIWYRLQGWL